MSLSHDYFGILNLHSYDLWATEMTLNGMPVAVYLSLDSDNAPTPTLLNTPLLDKCAAICQHIEQFDQENRDFLVAFLNKDSGFVDDYVKGQENFADSERLTQFYQGDKSITSFVALLQAMQINLIISETKSMVATDYMIDPTVSDQILCVYRKLGGDLIDIALER